MRSIKSILDDTLTKAPTWQSNLIAHWPDMVGNLANIMSLEKIYGGTLIVGVYEQSWLQELFMLSGVIVKTINEQLGSAKVEKIQFKLATRKEKIITQKIIYAEPEIQQIPLTIQEKNVLNIIKDDELRTVLHLFLTRCKQKNLSKEKS